MKLPSLDERAFLADKIRGQKQKAAEAVTEAFFRSHPEWLIRFGPAGKLRGIEDAGFHLEFLAGAIESGSTAAFQEYVRWTFQVLMTRGIETHFVIENLEQLEQFLAGILTDKDMVLVTGFIDAGKSVSAHKTLESEGPASKIGLDPTRQLFIQALLQSQRKAASNIVLEAFRQGHSIPDIYAEVIQEALVAIGKLWQANQITVAEEHVATAIAQFVMAQLYPLLPLPESSRGTAVITGVEGELHQVGANMVADVLEADGWRVHFLGTNMPHVGILKIVGEHNAKVLGISTTMLFNVPKVRRLIVEARAAFHRQGLQVFVGGGAFHSAPNLPLEIGADGYAADLRSAVALLR